MSSLDDILGHDDNPFVTDVRQEAAEEQKEPAKAQEEPVSITSSPEDAQNKSAEMPAEEEYQPDNEVEVDTTAAQELPVLNELEQMLKEALMKMQIPTALYGIEEDKEGAVCIRCDPKDGEWYVYDIKDGKMTNFTFYTKEKGKTAGKAFLEQVTKKMNS